MEESLGMKGDTKLYLLSIALGNLLRHHWRTFITGSILATVMIVVFSSFGLVLSSLEKPLAFAEMVGGMDLFFESSLPLTSLDSYRLEPVNVPTKGHKGFLSHHFYNWTHNSS